MKYLRILLALGSGLFALPQFLASVSAAPIYPTSQKHIVLDDAGVSDPFGITAVDPNSKQETTYMPIWYIMQALSSLNISSSWDGNRWTLTPPKYITLHGNFSNVTNKQGYKNIYINNTLIQSVPTIASPDPVSDVSTAYMPIWYVMQLLKDINIAYSWDGTTWKIQTQSTSSDSQNDWGSIAGPSVINMTTGDPINIWFTPLGVTRTDFWLDSPTSSLPYDVMFTDGHLFGMPYGTGTYKFKIAMEEDSPQNSVVYRTITMNVFGVMDITTLSIPPGRKNINYPVFQLHANNPEPGIKWWAVQGTLPPGLHLKSNGQIYGSPTQVGRFSVEIAAAYPDPVTHESENLFRKYTIYITN